MPLTLLTIAELQAYVPGCNLPAAQLQQVGAAAEGFMVDRLGPHTGNRTVTDVVVGGMVELWPPASAVVSVKRPARFGNPEVVLGADEYALDPTGRWLDVLRWDGTYLELEYTPTIDQDARRDVLGQMVAARVGYTGAAPYTVEGLTANPVFPGGPNGGLHWDRLLDQLRPRF